MALLAPLAIEWLCVGIDCVHSTSIHAGLPKRQTRSVSQANPSERAQEGWLQSGPKWEVT